MGCRNFIRPQSQGWVQGSCQTSAIKHNTYYYIRGQPNSGKTYRWSDIGVQECVELIVFPKVHSEQIPSSLRVRHAIVRDKTKTKTKTRPNQS